MKRLVTTAALTAAFVSAFALATFQGVFTSTYKVSKTSDLGKAICMACHAKKLGGTHNPYGKDVDAALKKTGTKKLTPDVLKAVEGLDSDKDEVKNIDEIKAGKLPGAK